ncbi:MAG: response regulator [Bacillota bacterium]
MINVLLVDDQEIILKALKITLEKDNDIKVISTARNGEEAASICDRLKPDVVLMDVMMPVCDGVRGTKLIKDKNRSIKIIMITTFDDEKYIEQAIKNGADGYILKSIRDEDLKAAVRSTAAGLSIMQQSVFDHLKGNYQTKKHDATAKELEDLLTPREKEVLALIVDGMSNKDIANKLFLVEGRVKNIVSSILMKLDVKDRTQLAIFAIKNNLV